MKEKLLVMGVDTTARHALTYAKETGAQTIITDYYPKDSSPVKKLADEVWQLSITDLDLLEQRCREENVTGVYAGNYELCLDMANELAKRLGLPYFRSEQSQKLIGDKAEFKRCCQEAGLDVPKRYLVTPECCTLPEEAYPVAVKPIDGSGGCGFSVCTNNEQLRVALKVAMENSPTGEALVEQYIEGEEVGIYYYFFDGKAIVNRLVEQRFFTSTDGKSRGGFSPQRNNNLSFLKETDRNCFQKLFQLLGCEEGTGFIQAIQKDGKYYILEMNYRVEGQAGSMMQHRARGYSTVEYLVDFALGRDLTERKKTIIRQETTVQNGECVYYMPVLNPGKIRKISGVEEVMGMDGVDITLQLYHEGEEVKATNDMNQLAFYINIWGEDWDRIAEKIRKINQTLHVTDEQGEELLVFYDDYEAIAQTGKKLRN